MTDKAPKPTPMVDSLPVPFAPKGRTPAQLLRMADEWEESAANLEEKAKRTRAEAQGLRARAAALEAAAREGDPRVVSGAAIMDLGKTVTLVKALGPDGTPVKAVEFRLEGQTNHGTRLQTYTLVSLGLARELADALIAALEEAGVEGWGPAPEGDDFGLR